MEFDVQVWLKKDALPQDLTTFNQCISGLPIFRQSQLDVRPMNGKYYTDNVKQKLLPGFGIHKPTANSSFFVEYRIYVFVVWVLTDRRRCAASDIEIPSHI